MNVVEYILTLFGERGEALYFGEHVTQAEHALQCAHLAKEAGAGPELIASALMHDVGHLLHGLPEGIAGEGIDGRHEAVGAAWLARYFGPAVVEPIRLHVAAKRYLTATDPGYRETLSAASLHSLSLQGGPMSPEEAARFEAGPWFRAAIDLRLWDDAAKVTDWTVPGWDHYRSCLEAAAAAGGMEPLAELEVDQA